MTHRFLLLLSTVLTACTETEEKSDTADSGEPIEYIEHEAPESCDAEVRVDGVPVAELGNPAINDQWYVLMYCDDVLQLGTYTLTPNPPELVSVDAEEPILTFLDAGTVSIDYRMGRNRATFSVDIEE
jgi:hypothetical protein